LYNKVLYVAVTDKKTTAVGFNRNGSNRRSQDKRFNRSEERPGLRESQGKQSCATLTGAAVIKGAFNLLAASPLNIQ
jgi:hypothetical protein